MSEEKEKKKPLTLIQKIQRGVLIVFGLFLLLTMIRLSNSPGAAATTNPTVSNVEASPAAQKPQGQKFDVRLSGKNSTTLEEYYYGKTVGTKAIVTFNGSDPKNGGTVEVMFEWDMTTGHGTWKIETHPKRGYGQRADGDMLVEAHPSKTSFNIVLLDRQGNEWEKGEIIPL